MPPLLLPLGKCAVPQTGNPSCCVLDSRTKLCRFSVAQKQTRVVPRRGAPVGLGCPDHAAWARCCSCSCPQACREVRAQRQASRSRRELFPARRTSPGKRGHSGGSGSGAGPGALSTPLPAPSHRAPFFWEGSGLKSHHFTKWLLFLLKPNHSTCQTGVTKRLQKNRNNPKTLLQWMNPPISQEQRSGDSPGLSQGLFDAGWVLSFYAQAHNSLPRLPESCQEFGSVWAQTPQQHGLVRPHRFTSCVYFSAAGL